MAVTFSTTFVFDEDSESDNTVFIIVAVVIMVISVFLCIIFVRKSRNKMQKLKTYGSTMKSPNSINTISNALAVIICIGDYDEDQCNSPDVKDSILRDLPIDKDIENLTKLFNELEYKIISKQKKTYWTQNDIMKLLTNEIPQELFDNDKELKYDGLIICVSCHGQKNSIVTSDFKLIDKTAFHRIISGNHAKIREIPRIFIFDSCEGNAQRINRMMSSISPKSLGSVEEEEEMGADEEDEKGKFIGLEDVERGTEWPINAPNPDYKLVVIHSANTGFQAKIDTRFGSFLIFEFCQRMRMHLENGTNEGLGLLFDGIQNTLHDKGKQQTINVFNNNTRYLQLRKNERDKNSVIEISYTVSKRGLVN